MSYFLSNGQINDYVAGYHDGALLLGKVLRERMLEQRSGIKSEYNSVSDNPFGGITFDGGYKLQLRVSNTMGSSKCKTNLINIKSKEGAACVGEGVKV